MLSSQKEHRALDLNEEALLVLFEDPMADAIDVNIASLVAAVDGAEANRSSQRNLLRHGLHHRLHHLAKSVKLLPEGLFITWRD